MMMMGRERSNTNAGGRGTTMAGGRGKHEERREVTVMQMLPPQEVGTCFFKVKSTYNRDIYAHPRLVQLE